MARPKKKPGYDAEKVRNDFFQEVAEYYKESSKVSLRDVAAEFDITLLKVRKVLITAGVSRLYFCKPVRDYNSGSICNGSCI